MTQLETPKPSRKRKALERERKRMRACGGECKKIKITGKTKTQTEELTRPQLKAMMSSLPKKSSLKMK